MVRKIATGIWFIFFGIIALLHNFDVIHFNFYAIIKYWPLLIIAIGANLILQNRKIGALVSFLLNLCICIFLCYVGMTSKDSFSFNFSTSSETSSDTTNGSKTITYPYHDQVTSAQLEFNIGAADLKMEKPTSATLFDVSSSNDNLILDIDDSGDSTSAQFAIHAGSNAQNKMDSKIQFSLNPNPTWNLIFNMGATKFDADFSPYTFSNIEINSGAASLTLKFGLPKLESATIEINSGVSKCSLSIPKEAACMIEYESILSSKKIKGFEEKDGTHKTPDYDSARQKYIFKITGAANSLSVNRY